jgi:adenylate cyclase
MSEVLSPRDVSALVVDVMEALSVCVLEQRGVIVDYIGDAILAMWNAPATQPDHATRASRAALAMRATMPAAVASWREKIGKPLNVTIGLATGPVQVGNIGSRRRFKYGPLGHTVNLASRMQGATKQLGVPILLAGATRERLDGDFAVRRLCTLRFVGIDGGVDTFELFGETAPEEWHARRKLYEEALKDFESKHWSESCRRIYPLLQEDQGHFDYPALTLAARAVECLRSNPVNFDPIFALSTK